MVVMSVACSFAVVMMTVPCSIPMMPMPIVHMLRTCSMMVMPIIIPTSILLLESLLMLLHLLWIQLLLQPLQPLLHLIMQTDFVRQLLLGLLVENCLLVDHVLEPIANFSADHGWSVESVKLLLIQKFIRMRQRKMRNLTLP